MSVVAQCYSLYNEPASFSKFVVVEGPSYRH